MKRWEYTSAHDLGLEASQRYCSPSRENDLAQNLLRLGWLTSTRLVFKFWNRLKIQGLENIPLQPPFVITANHTSHLDALVLASALAFRWRDQISPLAAGDYFFANRTRAGFSAMILNALPIWRKRQCGQRHELGDLRERLISQSAIYIVFPEGTRSRDGELHEFKPGFATLVAGTSIPVEPCHLSGCFDAMPPDKNLMRPRQIVLQIGKPVTFESVTNRTGGWRQICAVIQEKTVALQADETALHHHAHWRAKISITLRFSRFLLHRLFRS